MNDYYLHFVVEAHRKNRTTPTITYDWLLFCLASRALMHSFEHKQKQNKRDTQKDNRQFQERSREKNKKNFALIERSGLREMLNGVEMIDSVFVWVQVKICFFGWSFHTHNTYRMEWNGIDAHLSQAVLFSDIKWSRDANTFQKAFN